MARLNAVDTGADGAGGVVVGWLPSFYSIHLMRKRITRVEEKLGDQKLVNKGLQQYLNSLQNGSKE